MIKYCENNDTLAEADLCGLRIVHEDRVMSARAGSLEDTDVIGVSDLFKAMGDPTRLRILQALSGGEMCVCDLAALLGVTESAVSHQLRLLRQLRLVTNRREGVILYYRLADDHVTRLLELGLDHVRKER